MYNIWSIYNGLDIEVHDLRPAIYTTTTTTTTTYSVVVVVVMLVLNAGPKDLVVQLFLNAGPKDLVVQLTIHPIVLKTILI